MARINLLPWRDAYRQEKKKHFYTALMLVALVAGVVGFAWVSWVKSSISNQQERNTLLTKEITSLDKRVKQIEQLKEDKELALVRLQLINDLQGKRPLIVGYFDQLVRAVPKGIFINEMERKGSQLFISGVTESRNRVATFMRDLDTSEWFHNPNLKSIIAEPKYGNQASGFEMTVDLDTPNAVKEES